MSTFPHGSLVKIAAKAGISKQFVSLILTARRRITPDLAQRLVKAANELNLETNQYDWLNPELTKNPLFADYQ